MTRRAGGIALLCGLGAAFLSLPDREARSAEYVVPPIMPVPNAWQGRSQAVVRVLDKLDAHIETLTLKAGDTASYKGLGVTVRSCMDRPDGLPADSAAFLVVEDRRGGVKPFSGWTFSGQPSIGVFESPVYGVQLVTCGGELVAPLAPPLPPPSPPPASMIADQPTVPPPAAADSSTADAPDPPQVAMPGEAAPSGPAPDGGDPAQPDPVYPVGPPPSDPPASPPQ